MKHKLTAVTALAVSTVIALTGCATSSGTTSTEGGGELTTVTIGLPTVWSNDYSALASAEMLGYFEEEGLKPQWVNLEGGTTVATQVQQGAIDIGWLAADPVLIGHQPGGGFTIEYFANYLRRNIFGVQVPEDSPIKTAADLAGESIGVSNLAGTGFSVAQATVIDGGNAKTDASYVAVGIGAPAVTAVQSGQVAALSIWDSMYTRLEASGLEMRPIETEGLSDLFSAGLVALPQNLESDPDVYVGAARALMKGIAFAEANPEAALLLNWERFPEAKPAGKTDAEAVAAELAPWESRLSHATLASQDEKYGSFPDGTFEDYAAFLNSVGLLEKDVDLSEVYTDEYVDRINDFDRAAVVKQAEVSPVAE